MKKILIVDDEEDFCYFTKANIEAMGDFEVSICCDSRNAIGQVSKLRPDIILLDIMMPGLSGSEIAEELGDDDNTKDIPIIFSTALVTEKEAMRSRSTIGGRRFISKPVGMSALMYLINEILA